MIDTHCHLTSPEFGAPGRVEEVLKAARQAGIRRFITVSTTAADARRCLELATRHDDVWCSAGFHPLYSGEMEASPADPATWQELREIARHDRCVAWGELGLDNHYADPPAAVQRAVLSAQMASIEQAQGRRGGIDKPIIVHCRDAFDELLAVFADAPFPRDRYVFHCFTGGPEDVRRVLDFGAFVSFTGIVTFANAKDIQQAAKLVPADRIMVETDSPYLTPEPMRKVRPNEPQYVVHTARFLASLRGVDVADFEAQLDANADRFFFAVA
jgi:TatD DNase family protein